MRRTALLGGTLIALVASGTLTLPGTEASALPREAPRAAEVSSALAEEKAVRTAIRTGEAPSGQIALRAAETSGNPVEVTGLRQERRDVHANPTGTFTANEYTQPVRVRKNNAWHTVDDTLIQRPDGGWSPKAATVDVKFSAGGSGPFARMSRAGREYALSWPHGALPAPVVSGDTARYEEVLPGVDLAVRADVEGFGHYLIVKSAAAASHPQLTQIELGLTTKGLTVEKTASGVLRAVDSAVGGTVFEAAKPVMWDSSASPAGPTVTGTRRAIRATVPKADLDATDAGRKAPVGIQVTSDRMTLTPDAGLLRGANTVYPVVIDPIPKTIHRTAWTSVMSGMPSEQDWAYSGTAGMGKCPLNYNPTECAGIGVRRLLYTFPLASYAGKEIVSAQFNARVGAVYWADAKAEPVDLYRIGGKDRVITSASNWSNTQNDWTDLVGSVNTKISPTASCSNGANLLVTNGELLTEVRTATAASWKTMSLGLRAKDESDYPGWKRICGNSFLSIEYNTPPKQIDTRHMTSNPGGKCVTGAARPYTDELPMLRTEARDPDHGSTRTDKVKVEFRIWFKDAGGVQRSYSAQTGHKAPAAGTPFEHRIKQRPTGTPQIPQNAVISWEARARDGNSSETWGSWGAWSSSRCEIIWDSTRPKPPVVKSPEYPADDQWHHGVGTQGTFTLAAVNNDVKEYQYYFDDEPLKKKTTTAGAPVTIPWTPTWAGRHGLTVMASDGAGNTNLVPAYYEFLVTDGKQAAGEWSLADPQGSPDANDESGRHPGVVGTGVTFGAPGPGGVADSSARFDGSTSAYVDAWGTVTDTGKSFAVSAWARPASLTKDMTLVSQDSTGEPGFVLGYDAVDQAWVFSTPDFDVDAMTHWRATASGIQVTANEWVMVTGVYNANATGGPELRIFVNEILAGTAKRHTVFSSLRSLQIGRTLAKSGYRDHFHGDMADVRVYDRVVPDSQVAQMMTVKPERKGYWPLETAPAGDSPNVQVAGANPGPPLKLKGTAELYHPANVFEDSALTDTGHLTLNGTTDWAGTDSAVISGAASYTVGLRVRPTTINPTRSQTVLSLPGQHKDRVAVRYDATNQKWALSVTSADSTTAETVTITENEQLPSTDVGGQHLTVVYNALTHEVRLYVDGRLTETAEKVYDHTTWPSTGGLQVGRSARAGGTEHFAGAVDEVRVYAGAVDPVTALRMSQPTGDPTL